MTDILYDLPTNCNFDEVYNANNQEFDCSPKLKDKFFSPFSGLLINAPNVVVWPKGLDLAGFPPGPDGDTDGPLRFMVSGLGRFPYDMLGLQGDVSSHVLMVAVNQQTAQSYSGRMPQPDSISMPPPDDDEPELPGSNKNKKTLLTSHFNFDLVHDLGIPIDDATYIIYATLDEHKSNVLTVKTQVEK